MLGLVRLQSESETEPRLPRLWLVFFGEACGRPWWARALRPGFRHVSAAAWFDRAERWIYFDPLSSGLHIEIDTHAGFGSRFAQLWRDSAAILRVRAVPRQGRLPPAFFCVGAMKALLGTRSRALSPRGLYRDLLREGAELVERQAA